MDWARAKFGGRPVYVSDGERYSILSLRHGFALTCHVFPRVLLGVFETLADARLYADYWDAFNNATGAGS